MGTGLVIEAALGLNLDLCIIKRQEPVRIQIFLAQPPVGYLATNNCNGIAPAGMLKQCPHDCVHLLTVGQLNLAHFSYHLTV